VTYVVSVHIFPSPTHQFQLPSAGRRTTSLYNRDRYIPACDAVLAVNTRTCRLWIHLITPSVHQRSIYHRVIRLPQVSLNCLIKCRHDNDTKLLQTKRQRQNPCAVVRCHYWRFGLHCCAQTVFFMSRGPSVTKYTGLFCGGLENVD
jgi:hypothetical protein